MTAQEHLPDQEAWSPWTPTDLFKQLAHVERPWCIVGGWALDVWQGQQTRTHEDLEFTILREDFPVFREALGPLDFYAVKGGVFELLESNCEPAADIFQIWCFDTVAQAWRVDMMIEPGTPDRWVYKRDTSITGERSEMVCTNEAGIPYLRPAAILLFKAKHLRKKDQADFNLALPRLSPVERQWLMEHLAQVHPGHEWLARI